jgi:DNA-binding NtrC family response regulator
LFGHEKGAFTNAHEAKQGLVEVANGGTLFLDEIGDISPMIQPKLLRFLETGEFRRVGGTNQLQVDVRVVCATNKDLLQEVAAGRFREDLLYRLNVITLVIPPLSERKEDIPLLAEHFAKAKSRGPVPKQISARAMKRLCSYAWPGNVRELEHMIEGAILISTGDTIDESDLPLFHLQAPMTAPPSEDLPQVTMTLQQMERIHIMRVLEQYHFSRAKTAESLGISKKTLYLKIKEYGIPVPD